MKAIKSITVLAAFFAVLPFMSFRTDSKYMATMVINTSVVCEMCKDRIEKNLIFESGVKEVSVDIEKKIVTVRYRTDKTTPEKIKTALTKLGYSADDMKADEKAWSELPACCKKEGCGKP